MNNEQGTPDDKLNLAAQNAKLVLEGNIKFWNNTMNLAEQRIKNESELVEICKVQIEKIKKELELVGNWR